MMQAIVLLAARVLMASLFLVFGVRTIRGFEASAASFARLGFPVPTATTVLSIAVQLGAGLLLVLGWKARPAAWVLVLYVIIATGAAHRFWDFDAGQHLAHLTNFYKNLAIMGGLMLLGVAGPGALSVDRR